ncbi:hypothetical protein SGLAM104S_10187 [Streptomyces glaucescens]
MRRTGRRLDSSYGPIHCSYSFLYVPSALASAMALLMASRSLSLPFLTVKPYCSPVLICSATSKASALALSFSQPWTTG